jgi:hypothetical protein
VPCCHVELSVETEAVSMNVDLSLRTAGCGGGFNVLQVVQALVLQTCRVLGSINPALGPDYENRP